jgi:hypothetical protein
MDAVEERETSGISPDPSIAQPIAILALFMALSYILFLWEIQHNTLTMLYHRRLDCMIGR